MKELGPGANYLTNNIFMTFVGEHGATMKLANHKLDNLGYIQAFSGVQNGPDRLCCLTNKLELAHSLVLITGAKAKDDVTQKEGGKVETQLLVPASNNRLIEK